MTKSLPTYAKKIKQKKDELEEYFVKLEKKYVAAGTITDITAASFEKDYSGTTYGTTLQITTPGLYRLTENIQFNPNAIGSGVAFTEAYNSGDPAPAQFTTAGGDLDPAAFGIGFFAAISIQTDDVVIDLNGYNLAQSLEHSLQQRFYADIELANQPFLSSQGPHDFGETLRGAKRCWVKNGTLGLSSHHGIHGNNNFSILVQDVEFTSYEVGAISVNNVDGLYVERCQAQNNIDIKVLGAWSSARFIRPYINTLVDDAGFTTTLTVGGVALTKNDIQDDLRALLNDGIDYYLNDVGSPPSSVYNNADGVIDGNAYAFLVNGKGVAVNGFPVDRKTSSANVYFDDVSAKRTHAKINEIKAFATGTDDNLAMNDPIGAVLQIVNLVTEAQLTTFKYSDIAHQAANTQLLVAKAVNAGYDFSPLNSSRSNITDTIIAWVEADTVGLDGNPTVCNGDSMFHVNKGLIAFKMDAVDCCLLINCRVYDAQNIAELGRPCDNLGFNQHLGKSNPFASLLGSNGSASRGFSFSSSYNCYVCDCLVDGLTSTNSEAIGMDIFFSSQQITVNNFKVGAITAEGNGTYTNYDGNPTTLPVAIGIRKTCDVKNVEIINLDCGKKEISGLYASKATELQT